MPRSSNIRAMKVVDRICGWITDLHRAFMHQIAPRIAPAARRIVRVASEHRRATLTAGCAAAVLFAMFTINAWDSSNASGSDASFQRALKKGPDPVSELSSRGEKIAKMYENGQGHGAKVLLDAWLEKEPESAEVRALLGYSWALSLDLLDFTVRIREEYKEATGPAYAATQIEPRCKRMVAGLLMRAVVRQLWTASNGGRSCAITDHAFLTYGKAHQGALIEDSGRWSRSMEAVQLQALLFGAMVMGNLEDESMLDGGSWLELLAAARKIDPKVVERYKPALGEVAESFAARGNYSSALLISVVTTGSFAEDMERLESWIRRDGDREDCRTRLVIALGYLYDSARLAPSDSTSSDVVAQCREMLSSLAPGLDKAEIRPLLAYMGIRG